jgi:hypothetical protein
MANLQQLKQDFEKAGRSARPRGCYSCNFFGVLVSELTKCGDAEVVSSLSDRERIGVTLDVRVTKICGPVCTIAEKDAVFRALVPHFSSFIANAKLLDTPKSDARPSIIPIPLSEQKITFYFTSKEVQLAEIAVNMHVQRVLDGTIDRSSFQTILSLFDQTLSVQTLRDILTSKDTCRFEEAKHQSLLLISAATINGNERDSDKFGKLMELIELKFGKKPSRVPEEKFMQSVATALQNKISELSRPLCVGVQYIQKWANRQF